jgi:amidase
MTELCDLDATELRALIGARQVSPVEVLDSCIDRIEAINPTLNAMVELRLGEARKEAKQAEQVVGKGADLGPLHGLPVAIKEAENVTGLRTTKGSPIYADVVAAEDCRMVASIREAGGIIVGKTNVPTLTNGLTTDNPIYGLTRNPFDLERTCAGSSGGAGVALATRMVPLATGSDTGGSIRGPASVSGVVGLRPSPGLVPSEERPQGWSVMTVLGPMARSVADTRMFLQGMMSTDYRDPFSGLADPALRGTAEAMDLGKLRVAVTADLGVVEATDTARATFKSKVSQFADAFGACRWDTPDMSGIHEVYLKLRSLVHMTRYAAEHLADPSGLTPQSRTDLRRGDGMTARDAAAALAEQTEIYRRFQAFFQDIDILITPGRTLPIYSLDEIDTANARLAKEEAAAKNDLWAGRGNINAPITMMGHPAMTIPAGKDPAGLPFGVQIVGPYRGDAFLLDVGEALESYFATKRDLSRPIADVTAFGG